MKVWIDNREIEMQTYKITGEVFAVEATRGQAGRNGYLNKYSPQEDNNNEAGYIFVTAIGNKRWVTKKEFEKVEVKEQKTSKINFVL